MVRQGRYTKRVSPVTRFKRGVKRRWRAFNAMSKKKKFLIIGAPILAFLILTPLITYIYYYNDIADQERLMNRNNTGIVLTDKNGDVFYETGRAQHREMVKLADISDNVEKAVIAAEDKDFYKHEGFSITGIGRAIYNGLNAGGIAGGGSTITQQLAKMALLSENQNFLRKYQELAISVAIEQRYSKDQILEMYLNTAFFGGSIFGIEEAAKAYFNKSPKDLTLAESSMLIGILPAPNAYSPTLGNPEYAKERQGTVLKRMVDNGYITSADRTAILAEQLTYAPMSETEDSVAPHFVQMVMDELYEKYGEQTVVRSGYQVRTTLDLALQKQLNENIKKHISYIERNGGSNASGVAIDPKTGQVLALAGSADWNNETWGKVNMVTTPRQPGSSFKSIYYARALADGTINPATIIADVPTDFNGYKPQNANRGFSGDVTVRSALARSLNIPAVKIMEKIGINTAIEQANEMGISTIDKNTNYGLSLALGSAEASLLQMTNAYAAFANQGEQFNTTFLKQVNNKYGDNIFKENGTSKKVISAEGAYLVSSILSDKVARAPTFGSSLTVPGKTAAVKTGTTDDQRDAWTIGYTPELAVGVWVGNNDNATMLNGGSGMAGPIWVNTMNEALRGRQDIQFPVPAGIVQRSVCPNGGLANRSGYGTYTESFLSWNLPTKSCTPEKSPEELEAERKAAEEKQKAEDEKKRQEEEAAQQEEEQNQDEETGDGTGTDDGTGTGNNGGNGNGSGTTPTLPVTP